LFFYQDADTGDFYYNTPDNSLDSRIKVVLPQKEKRKAQDKRRPPDERQSLVSRLLAWRHDAHIKDPLALVTPPSLIIDDDSIISLAKIHPQDLTGYQQITVLLDQTVEWEEEWSMEIFNVIQQFDEDVIALRKTTVAQKKNQQKRMKIAQNAMSFEESTKEIEEKARIKISRQLAEQRQSSSNVQILQTSTIVNLP